MPLAPGNPSVPLITPAGATVNGGAIIGGVPPYSSQLQSLLLKEIDKGGYNAPEGDQQDVAVWANVGAPVVGAAPVFLATGLEAGVYAFQYVTTDSTGGTPLVATSPEVVATLPDQPPMVALPSTTQDVVRRNGEIKRYAFTVPSTGSHTIGLTNFSGQGTGASLALFGPDNMHLLVQNAPAADRFSDPILTAMLAAGVYMVEVRPVDSRQFRFSLVIS